MNVVLNQDEIDIDCVFFNEPIKNSIIENGLFIRMLYSTEIMVLNGIYINMPFKSLYKTNDGNKVKLHANVQDNIDSIEFIKNIERLILEKHAMHQYPLHKKKNLKLSEQMSTGYIKYIIDNTISNSYILKISGIWESTSEYGLTFKFIEINHQLNIDSAKSACM